jgi:hypothetical protein
MEDTPRPQDVPRPGAVTRKTPEEAIASVARAGLPVDQYQQIANRTFNGNLTKAQHLGGLLTATLFGQGGEPLEFGFYNTNDLPVKLSDRGGRWTRLTTELWNHVEDFNALVAERHGIQEHDGALWFGNKAIVYRSVAYGNMCRKEDNDMSSARLGKDLRAEAEKINRSSGGTAEIDIKISTSNAKNIAPKKQGQAQPGA